MVGRRKVHQLSELLRGKCEAMCMMAKAFLNLGNDLKQQQPTLLGKRLWNESLRSLYLRYVACVRVWKAIET